MATVVITILIRASIHVSKMDADFKEKRRQRISSQREKRWSMNSQRLEEIVAELMKPIGDLRRSFDTDLSALLEEYLTEAGLRALSDSDGAAGQAAVPNFAELALLLQHSASAYGRKVDYLYQHVLSVSDTLHNTSIEMSNSTEAEAEGGTAGGGPRRRRGADSGAELGAALQAFGPLSPPPAAAALRPALPPAPPPTLPRPYWELAPRALAPGDVPLTDYGGEPIGLLPDFHSCWALRAGLLTDGLARHCAAALRPIPLNELQQAIEARAPPPLACSSPLPPSLSAALLGDGDGDGDGHRDGHSPSPSRCMPPPLQPPPRPALAQKSHKRKSETTLAELATTVKLRITKELVALARVEFSVPAPWLHRALAGRSLAVLALRRGLRAARRRHGPLRGFDYSAEDAPGFCGWSVAEAAAADAVAALAASATVTAGTATGTGTGRLVTDSDDDGFFEQSSSGESDSCPLQLTTTTTSTALSQSAEEWSLWQAGVLRRAGEAADRGGVDVARLAGRLLAALGSGSDRDRDHGSDCDRDRDHGSDRDRDHASDHGSDRDHDPGPARPFTAVLRDTATHPTDVSRLFLTTLFLANSGNVEVISGGALTVDSFSLRLLSRDPSRYSAAAWELRASASPAAPIASPAHTQPSLRASPAAPIASPAHTQPSLRASPAAPIASPAHTQPSLRASAAAPIASPAHTQPSLRASAAAPIASPAHTQPSLRASAAAPIASPAHTQPPPPPEPSAGRPRPDPAKRPRPRPNR